MLRFDSVSFSYPGHPVLRDFSMELPDGGLLAVMGPSGCGKSTLLRLASGLLKPDDGTVTNTFRVTSTVFQEPRLFPWLTVRQNLSAVSKKPREAASDIAELLSFFGLSDWVDAYPDQLSGGMQSRLAFARALIPHPDLLLLDEPFAALDQDLRGELIPALRKRFRENGISAILVTHQESDALLFADSVLRMDAPEQSFF